MTLLPLLATLVALLCGPLLYALARPRPALLAFVDGFVLASIAGLVLLEVLPGTYGDGGAWSLGFIALGAIGPSLVEHGLQRARREAHLATLALAMLGLLLHSIADGAALTPDPAALTPDPGHDAHGHAREALSLAIVIHSVPVGLVVWWVMAPVFGRLLPAVTLALMAIGTVAGYAFGLELNAVLGAQAFAWFQALVAGSILHVVFGRPHLSPQAEARNVSVTVETAGGVAALAALFALVQLDPHAGLLPRNWAYLAMAALALLPLLRRGLAGAGGHDHGHDHAH